MKPHVKVTITAYATRALLLSPLIIALLWLYGDLFMRPLLPYFSLWLQTLTEHYAFRFLVTEIDQRSAVILQVTVTDTIQQGFPPVGLTTSVYAHVSRVILPLVLIFTLVLAWPRKTLREWLMLSLQGILAAALILIFTVPIQLFGIYENGVLDTAARLDAPYVASGLRGLQQLFDAGLVWVLAVIAAMLCLGFARIRSLMSK